MNTIIWLSFVNWDHIYEQRIHHLVRCLAVKFRIVFVESKFPYYRKLLTLLSNPSGFFNGTLRKHNNKIEILSLYTLFPETIMTAIPFLYRLNGIFLKRALLRFLRKADITRFIAGSSEPFLFNTFLSSLQAEIIFYDCSDDYMQFRSAGAFASEMEKSLIEQSDIVFASSRKLLELKSAFKTNCIHLLPNAVDYNLFHECLKTENKIFWETKPVIGYVGHIAEWFDFDLIAHLLRSFADFLFVFIGMVEKNVAEEFTSLQRQFKNIIKIPPQPYSRIAAYIDSFDVAIIPFRRIPIVEAVDPLKLYEYAACGKPIVSTFWAELEPLRELIYLASSKKQFADCIQTALRTQPTAKLKSFALENTWQKRASRMEILLQQVICLNSKAARTKI